MPYNVAIKLLYVQVSSRIAVVSSNQRSTVKEQQQHVLQHVLWSCYCGARSVLATLVTHLARANRSSHLLYPFVWHLEYIPDKRGRRREFFPKIGGIQMRVE